MNGKRPLKSKTRVARGAAAYKFGLQAERYALVWLLLRFYRLLGRRVKTKAGEIDLIMRRGNVIVFVEVKASDDFDRAIEALSPHQQGRLFRAASLYVASRPAMQSLDMRFDMVLVARGRLPRHLPDAFRP
ncbi:MAG: YraN family protein [Pseudomonadota bacterium]